MPEEVTEELDAATGGLNAASDGLIAAPEGLNAVPEGLNAAPEGLETTTEDLEAVTQELHLQGTLKGHSDWVTQIATNPTFPNIIMSSSRDKSVMIWNLSRNEDTGCIEGSPMKSLRGHSHFVSDVVMSSKGQHALTASWDHEIRLWDLVNGQTTERFKGHDKDVLSVALSADDRQIVSGSRDKTIKLWNYKGECRHTFQDDSHTNWVSCTRFSPDQTNPMFVSCGWDRVVKAWDLTSRCLKTTHYGHTSYLNCLAISPEGSLCASGGKDGSLHMWHLQEEQHLYTLDNHEEINALCFNTTRYWVCVAAGSIIKIWDLETKDLITELKLEPSGWKTKCTSLAWSVDGQVLFAGYTDSIIRFWEFCILPRQDDIPLTGLNTEQFTYMYTPAAE